MFSLKKSVIVFFLLILIISVSGCSSDDKKMEEYNKCASVCASVLEDDFVTQKLCNDECRKKFLDEG